MNMTFQHKMAKFAWSVVVTSSLFACNLDEKLTSVYNADNAYVTEQNAQEGVNGIYRYLKGGTHPATFYLNDVSTDAAYKAGLDYEIMNDNNLSGNVDVARAYNGNFQMIGCANSAIDNITPMAESKFKVAAHKKELLGEAHFIAASSLPDTWDKKNVGGEGGRPTSGAAYGYLMRLYMRKAGYLREQGKDATANWKLALNYANRVIATGHYALQPTIWDVFDPTSEKSLYNNEIIFAVRSNERVPSGSSDIALYFTPWSYNYGWDIFSIPLELYWKYDPTDERFSKLLVGEYTDVYDANKKYKVPTRAQVGTLNNELSSPVVVELAQAYTNKYFYEKAGTYNYNTPNNLILLRYADVLLCKAEILNELNGVNQTSIDLLNQIRARAFGNTSHNYSLTDFATPDDFRSALCDERLLELNNEGCRRIDLIRMGLWKNRMDAYMDAIKTKVETKERNMGLASGALRAEWSIYPKFSTTPLKRFDKRRYYPIPKVYSSKYPDLLNNRNFKEE